MLGVLGVLSILTGGNRDYSYSCVSLRNIWHAPVWWSFPSPWVVSCYTWAHQFLTKSSGIPVPWPYRRQMWSTGGNGRDGRGSGGGAEIRKPCGRLEGLGGSVQFSLSVVSDSLRPHGLQQARPPCPSPAPRAYSNSCPSSWWCHPTISSSVVPFSSHLQSFPGSFQMSQFFKSGGQSIGVSASASVLPMNIQDSSPLGLTGWISCCPRDSQEFSPTPQFKSISSSVLSFLYGPTLTSKHDYWKNHSFD